MHDRDEYNRLHYGHTELRTYYNGMHARCDIVLLRPLRHFNA